MKKITMALALLSSCLFGIGIAGAEERPLFVRGYVDVYDQIDSTETKLVRADWDVPTGEPPFSNEKRMAVHLMWDVFKQLLNKDVASRLDYSIYLRYMKAEEIPYLLHMKMDWYQSIDTADDRLEAVLLVNVPTAEGVKVVEVSRREIWQDYRYPDTRMAEKLAKLFVKDLEKKFNLNAAQK